MSSPDTKHETDENSAASEMAPAASIEASKVTDPGLVRDWHFYMVFVALSITALLSSIEATIISTALPTIVNNLNVGSNYAWVANSYFLTRLVKVQCYPSFRKSDLTFLFLKHGRTTTLRTTSQYMGQTLDHDFQCCTPACWECYLRLGD